MSATIVSLRRPRTLAQANVNRWFASGRRFGFLESLPFTAVAFLAGFCLATVMLP